MKITLGTLLLVVSTSLLTPTSEIQGTSIPVNAEYEKEGEAATGWHGLLPIINDFLDMIRTGNSEKAYYTYTTEELQKQTPLKEFVQLVNTSPVLKNNRLFSFQTFYFDNGLAVFQGALISTFGDSIQTEFDLKPIGPSWKIDGLHLFHPETIMLPEVSE